MIMNINNINFVILKIMHTITIIINVFNFFSGNYNLQIVDSKAEDSGSYRCMVTSGGSGIMSNLGRLVVESAPEQEYPTCQSSETNQVAVGETVTISCTVSYKPKIKGIFRDPDKYNYILFSYTY